MNLKGSHTCMIHPTLVLCCCFCIALTVEANPDEEETNPAGHSRRIRKHADTNTITQLYKEESLRLLFNKYGENGTMSMNYEEFKHFLKNLGLGEEDADHHADNNEHSHDSVRSKRLVSSENLMTRQNTCLPAVQLYNSLEKNSSSAMITKDDVVTLCPVLLHQLDVQACQHQEDEREEKAVPVKQVWGYGFASVTIISLVSITGILVVPCTKRYPGFYTNLISFLVAVAIGALMGDALLHLLPHSYGLHSHKGHDEGGDETIKASTVVWRGSVAVAGILLFFTCEKLMHFRKERESNAKKKSCNNSVDDVDTHKQLAAEPLISNRQPLMSGCRSLPQGNLKRPNLQHNHSDAHLIHIHNDNQVHQLYETRDIPMVKMECGEDTCDVPCEDYSCPEGKCENQEEACDGVVGMNDVRISKSDPGLHIEPTEIKEADEENGSLGHGHSHKHSHGHSHDHGFAGGIATVAWMVVMGDGLHNFCDGIAIGAAFANSITGGVSTSIAIFCHEIPHEVGDFAVMLKSGMSVRKALAYMGLSSVLAYIGMILGVAIGNIEEANLWIFAMTGGMFLYIALVDLLPELLESTNVHIHTIALQTFGIAFGMGIMIIIGLYEEALQEALD